MLSKGIKINGNFCVSDLLFCCNSMLDEYSVGVRWRLKKEEIITYYIIFSDYYLNLDNSIFGDSHPWISRR